MVGADGAERQGRETKEKECTISEGVLDSETDQSGKRAALI